MGIVADTITEMLSTPTIQQGPYVNWYKAVISRARLWTLLAYAQTCLSYAQLQSDSECRPNGGRLGEIKGSLGAMVSQSPSPDLSSRH